MYKKGGQLQHRPPLRRKRSLRNGRPRLPPYNNGANMYTNNCVPSEIIRRNDLSTYPHFDRKASELGSVADESLTSCTGPISHDESDFSSFNYSPVSRNTAAKTFKKDGKICITYINYRCIIFYVLSISFHKNYIYCEIYILQEVVGVN